MIYQELNQGWSIFENSQDKAPLKKVKEKISCLVNSLSKSSEFADFFVQDLFSRVDSTLKTVVEGREVELTELTVEKLKELPNCLNPMLANFATKLILGSEALNNGRNLKLYLDLLNCTLASMTVFCADINSKVVPKLLKTCS